MYLSNEVIESVGKSLVFDFLYIRGAFTNVWNWVIDTWSIKEWNPKWDSTKVEDTTTKVWDTTTNVWDTKWDTKMYDEAYCDLNLLDISHEKTE